MKKLIAAVLAVLCLAGCSAKEEQTEMIGVSVVTKNETAEAPAEETAPSVQEFELEVEEALPEDLEPGEGGSVAVPVELWEGLVGDAVGYSFEYPVFEDYAAVETMNAFYLKLVEGLEAHATDAVNTACLERNCIANVYGKVTYAMLAGDELEVGYECRVEYSDTEEPVVNTRTDVWNIQTGEVTSEVG